MAEINWVKERSTCSLVRVFEMLKLQVREDVRERNEAQPQLAGYNFEMAVLENSFSVYINKTLKAAAWGGKKRSGTVVFELCEDEIQVNDKKGEPILKATLTLNDFGECRVRINNEERELWQMRRAALEDLFFNTL